MRLAVFCLAVMCCSVAAHGETQNNKGETRWQKPTRVEIERVLERHGGDIMLLTTEREGVDPRLVVAITTIESRGNPLALSPKGAKGAMQTTEEADVDTGIECDSFQSVCSFEKGISYLDVLINRYRLKGDRLILAYYAGPSVAKKEKNPDRHPYVQSVRYVERRILLVLE